MAQVMFFLGRESRAVLRKDAEFIRDRLRDIKIRADREEREQVAAKIDEALLGSGRVLLVDWTRPTRARNQSAVVLDILRDADRNQATNDRLRSLEKMLAGSE